jgi:hypothetical protein
MIYSPWIYLCKNHPLDDLQENNFFAKHERIAEMCCWFSSAQFVPVKVFGRLIAWHHIGWLEEAV